MDLESFLEWLETTAIAKFVQTSPWAFPAIESLHVIAIASVVGLIAIVDLRLIGLASRDRPVSEILRDYLWIVWVAYAVAVVSGTLMFVTSASSYAHNLPFILKMIFMLLAGINMLIFEMKIVRTVKPGDLTNPALAVRMSGAISICLWIAIVVFGRWIGFTKFG
jgi:hypothetical protein